MAAPVIEPTPSHAATPSAPQPHRAQPIHHHHRDLHTAQDLAHCVAPTILRFCPRSTTAPAEDQREVLPDSWNPGSDSGSISIGRRLPVIVLSITAQSVEPSVSITARSPDPEKRLFRTMTRG